MQSRRSSRWIEVLGAAIAVSCGGGSPSVPSVPSTPAAPASFAVFVFSKTEGFRHDSIPAGIAAVQRQGRERGFTADAGEDAASFSDDILNGAQQTAFERFIRRGGGLLGAYFAGHPDIQTGTVRVETPSHPSVSGLLATWIRRDEWYNFQTNPRGSLDVLATLDERTYSGGTMAPDHPIIWSHGYEGGRAWYTAGGHTTESFSEPLFVAHIGSAIVWAAGR